MRTLFVVNVDWFFLSHRLPIALAAVRAGHEVHIATSLTGPAQRLTDLGLVVHPIHVDRSRAGLPGLLALLWRLWRLFWSVRPDVLHLVTIKPVLLGGLAARLAPVGGVVYAISGLGHVFLARGWGARLRRQLVELAYRLALGAGNKRVIFQNTQDQATVCGVARVSPKEAVLIPGSGVDLGQYRHAPLPGGPPVVLMAARLLQTKGVVEFVAAAQQLRAAGANARFWLVGDVDPDNPASVLAEQLAAWRAQAVVEVLGHRSDMAQLMAQAHVVVLPSYSEGFPKVLIEAAACGRAVVTTDVPGCREAIVPGETGLLVPPRSVPALAEAIGRLLANRQLCERMGNAGRAHAEKTFDVASVVQTHLAIYEQLSTQ